MDTFSSICNFSLVSFTDYDSGGKPVGKICLTSYFEASQAVIATMIMSGSFGPLPTDSKVVLSAQSYKPLRDDITTRMPASSNGSMIAVIGGLACVALFMKKSTALVLKRRAECTELRSVRRSNPSSDEYAAIEEALIGADFRLSRMG